MAKSGAQLLGQRLTKDSKLKMNLNHTKIQVENEDQNRIVQYIAIHFGQYKWNGASRKNHIKWTNQKYLFLDDGFFNYTDQKDVFDMDANKEIKFDDLVKSITF